MEKQATNQLDRRSIAQAFLKFEPTTFAAELAMLAGRDNVTVSAGTASARKVQTDRFSHKTLDPGRAGEE